MDEPVPLTDRTSVVKIEHENVTVKPGQTTRIHVTVPVPDTDAQRAPVYSGYITVSGPDGSVKSTYLGAAFSLKATKILVDGARTFGIPLPTLLDPATGEAQTEPRNYTLVNGGSPELGLWSV